MQYTLTLVTEDDGEAEELLELATDVILDGLRSRESSGTIDLAADGFVYQTEEVTM